MGFAMSALSGCGLAKVKIASYPDQADILSIRPNGEEVQIGKTPFEIEGDKLAEACRPTDGTKGPCRLVVSKKGYARESLFVNSMFFKENFSASVKLNPSTEWVDLEKNELFLGKMNDAAHYTARLQEQTIRRDLEAALETAKQFVAAHSKLSVAWDLLGNVYFLKKQYSQAAESYRKSLALNPTNIETQRVLKNLRARKGESE